MSTATNGIATRSDCNSINAGSFNSDLNRCPTKSEILATGKLLIGASYSDNQLVKYSDLSASAEYWNFWLIKQFTFTVNSSTGALTLKAPSYGYGAFGYDSLPNRSISGKTYTDSNFISTDQSGSVVWTYPANTALNYYSGNPYPFTSLTIPLSTGTIALAQQVTIVSLPSLSWSDTDGFGFGVNMAMTDSAYTYAVKE